MATKLPYGAKVSGGGAIKTTPTKDDRTQGTGYTRWNDYLKRGGR